MENGTNPNGANQHTPDPREQLCWDFYVESINAGVPNALQSAIKAGYEKATAKQITVRSWFIERLGELERKEMLSKAEKKLAKTLTYNVENQDGEIKTDLLRIQTDVAKFVANTLGKNKYSTKGEEGLDKIANKITGVEIKIRE